MTSDEADWLLEAQQRILKLEREIQRMKRVLRRMGYGSDQPGSL